MGWFKCWNQPVEDGEIFVPEWGWVGSQKMKKFLVAYVGNIFSSPLGVGLVPFEIDVMQTWFLFSSPLGDGLVLHRVDSKAKIGVIFVPEWGWVGSYQ